MWYLDSRGTNHSQNSCKSFKYPQQSLQFKQGWGKTIIHQDWDDFCDCSSSILCIVLQTYSHILYLFAGCWDSCDLQCWERRVPHLLHQIIQAQDCGLLHSALPAEVSFINWVFKGKCLVKVFFINCLQRFIHFIFIHQNLHFVLPLLLPTAQHSWVSPRSGLLLHLPARQRRRWWSQLLLQQQHEDHVQDPRHGEHCQRGHRWQQRVRSCFQWIIFIIQLLFIVSGRGQKIKIQE